MYVIDWNNQITFLFVFDNALFRVSRQLAPLCFCSLYHPCGGSRLGRRRRRLRRRLRRHRRRRLSRRRSR